MIYCVCTKIITTKWESWRNELDVHACNTFDDVVNSCNGPPSSPDVSVTP
jgi:hypothetical protein